MKSIILTIIWVTMIWGQLHAQIITDRPNQTESSTTIDKGDFQIESGIQLSYEGDELLSTRQLLLPVNLFRLGLARGVELRLISKLEMIKQGGKSIQGMSDLEVGTKIQILKKENLNTEIAFIAHIVFPTGSIELTNDKYGTINKISISHQLSDDLGIGYNLGYNYFGTGDGNFIYSVSLGVGINDKLGIYLEPYGEITDFEEFVLNFDTGFTYLINNKIQADFSFGSGIDQRMNYLAIGCSWLINKKKK